MGGRQDNSDEDVRTAASPSNNSRWRRGAAMSTGTTTGDLKQRDAWATAVEYGYLELSSRIGGAARI
jgi:hypothetical protein